MASVCIIHGLNEGPAMSRKLEECLRSNGFEPVQDPAQADVIFAHSGGCFLVPAINRAAKIVLVGLPYQPGRPWFASTFIKVWREGKLYRQEHRLRQWAQKWSWHCRYAFRLRAAVKMAMNMRPSSPWNSVQPEVIVRNRHDAYAAPELHQLPFNGPRTFISLPGEHDDCWDNPEPYVAIIKSL